MPRGRPEDPLLAIGCKLILRTEGSNLDKLHGSVRMHGSRMAFAIMISIFLTKYAAAVTLVIQPHVSESALFQAVVCGLLGAFNGYFLGALARNMQAWQLLQSPPEAASTIAKE